MRAATLSHLKAGNWSFTVADEDGTPYAKGTAPTWMDAWSSAHGYLLSVHGWPESLR